MISAKFESSSLKRYTIYKLCFLNLPFINTMFQLVQIRTGGRTERSVWDGRQILLPRGWIFVSYKSKQVNEDTQFLAYMFINTGFVHSIILIFLISQITCGMTSHPLKWRHTPRNDVTPTGMTSRDIMSHHVIYCLPRGSHEGTYECHVNNSYLNEHAVVKRVVVSVSG